MGPVERSTSPRGRRARPGRARFRVFCAGRARGVRAARAPPCRNYGRRPAHPPGHVPHVSVRRPPARASCWVGRRGRTSQRRGHAGPPRAGPALGRRPRLRWWRARQSGRARGSSAACPAACAAPRGAGDEPPSRPLQERGGAERLCPGEPAGRRGAVSGASSEEPPEVARVRSLVRARHCRPAELAPGLGGHRPRGRCAARALCCWRRAFCPRC